MYTFVMYRGRAAFPSTSTYATLTAAREAATRAKAMSGGTVRVKVILATR